jgi:4-amino-4-deoxy-L-arabinose transferase-like glycosyltransferase
LAYVVGFALWPPRVFLIADEERYVSQALAFAHGERSLLPVDARWPAVAPQNVMHDAPPGTSLIQTPFVALGGWRAAALASVLALVVATLVTMRWLRENEYHPAFALIVPGFAGTLFFARIGMSDVPSAALVAITMWLLFRAGGQARAGSFTAGVAAGAIALFREPPLLLVAPTVIGAIARRRCAPVWLIAGGALGIALRLLAYKALLGTALYVRDPLYRFSLTDAAHGLPVYAGILLVLLPGGALLPLFYRGPRRAELVAGVVSYVALFVFYGYDAVRENGAFQGIILSSRYVIPALPILAFMAGERRGITVARLVAAAVVAGALLVHPAVWSRERTPLELTQSIFSATDANVPVVTNTRATLKYLSPAYGRRTIVRSYDVNADSIAALARAAGAADLVLFDRSDGQMYRGDLESNAHLLAEVRTRCGVQRSDERDRGGWGVLHLLRLSGCGARVLPYAVQ